MARCPTCHRRLRSGQACVEHGGAVAPARAATTDRPAWTQPLGACLGTGGFASVWEIGDGGVLKVAHASHDLARARLAREAEALRDIGPPAVPRLLDHGVLADGRAWIAMARIAGTPLGELVARGRLHRDDVTALARHLAEALVAIHAAGYAHRDLKPDNLVRNPDGSVTILDLGLARRVPDDPDDPNRAGVQVGSLEYMAPEQALDAAAAGTAADLYAFGCIVYELAAGRPPFVGDAAALERAHAALRPPPLGALASVSPALEELCHECLAKQPARRPASAAVVLARLRGAGDAAVARAQVSRSVMREGMQPVVLVWADLPKVDRALLATLASRKIAIVSQRGRRVLGGVVGAEHTDPAAAAVAAARDLVAAGARVALHLDALAVTTTAGGVTLAGTSASAPETWLPTGSWSGVVLTRALATVAQVPTRPSELGPGFVRLGDAGETAALVGRDAVLSDLAADAAAALAGAGPALALVVGDHGVGKTALAAALVPRLRELGARVVTGCVPPPGSGRPGHDALAELVATPAGPVVRAVGDALRAAARERPTAIVLDDLHLAEHDLLDALEYATLGGEPLPLWIVGLAAPRLDQRRPNFGARAERHRRVALAPLDEDAAVALTAELLRPAAYPPLRALRQIAAIARGNPMHLATLAREIHDRGAIRTRPNGEHFLDTTALDALPPLALGPWLAARELAPLAPEVVGLARVCAVLGGDLAHAELAAVIQLVEERGGATTTIDLDVGLAELVAHGILVTSDRRWSVRQALLEEGIYATTDEAARRAIHVAALDYWRGRALGERGVAARVARHAEAVGERRVAAGAFSALGEQAHAEHRALDADQAWQGAVRNLDVRDAARARALIGRARARYRLQRVRESLGDLDDALAIARELADPELEAAALLEKATALDWADDYTGSAAAAAAARTLCEDHALARFDPEVKLACARITYREARFVDAVAPLSDARAAARRAGHRETETIATVLLAPALVESRQLDAAAQVFDELIALCRSVDDRFHLAAAYANRTWLWADRGDVDRVAEDLGTVIQLAREGGHASLERIATHNLGENRLWEGKLDEALRLARRGLAIQRAHGEGTSWPDQLLLARVHAARGELAELRAQLAALRGVELADGDRAVVDVLELVLAPASPERWADALGRAGDVLGDQVPLVNVRLELGLLGRTACALPDALVTALRTLAAGNPIWCRRLAF